jgi:PKD repeat protein/photosystem II stability/assembly factor-like uncharacterized protein
LENGLRFANFVRRNQKQNSIMKKITLLVVILIALTAIGFSQNQQTGSERDYANYPYWIEMMQDQNANYFETVKAFNTYWENREVTRGSGYNPFKRWEWYQKFSIYPDGTRYPETYKHDVYEQYMSARAAESAFQGDWVNVGPVDLPDSPNDFWGNGRLNAIAFHPTDENIIYVGAPSGGLWVSEDRGQSWEVLTDHLPTLGVSSVIVDYENPDIIYIGSGDRDASDAPGLGVYKSTDGGMTWTQSNSGMGNVTVGRMIQHPDDPDVLFAATGGGIYASADGAASWTYAEGGSMKEIVFKPGDPSVIYASATGKFYRSTDSGKTWTRITNGLPTSANRAVIAVSEADPDYVYFLATSQTSFRGLYLSTDAGATFTQQSNTPNIMGWSCNGGSGGQAWYDLDMAADPLNEQIIYAGGINCWKSVDAGVTWTMSSNQVGDCGADAVHADLHVLEYNPVDGRLYVGNDGGIWWTDDGGDNWNRITNGLAIGQQYRMGQSKIISNHVITGYQDNGISSFYQDGWVQSDMYADGMDCQMDNTDTTLSYGCMQYGRMTRIVNNKATNWIAGQGVGGINESGSWVTPFTQHEYDNNVMFVGYDNIWRTRNLLNNQPAWTNITNGASSGKITVTEHSPADVDIFYFVPGSKLFRSVNILDDNPSFTNLGNYLPNSGAPTSVEAHPQDPEIVYITQNRRVYRSDTKGTSWTDITGNLPDVSMNDIAFYNRNGIEALYVGTHIGVFYKDENMDEWVMFSDGLPAAITITEIEIFHHPEDPGQDMVRASSYGRGLWESPPYYGNLTADFMTEDIHIPPGCAIDFHDISIGFPHSWEWTFEGGSPSTSNEPNPSGIIYDTEGTYEVTLMVTNPLSTDTETKSAYITVEEGMLPVVEFSSDMNAFCAPGIVDFTDESQGCPESWLWEIEPDSYTFFNDTDENSENPTIKFYEKVPYTITLTVTNVSGNSSETRVDYIQAGGYLPYVKKTFEAESFRASEWTIENPDDDITWQMYDIGGTTPGSTAAAIDLGNYQAIGQRDRLITPPFNLEGMESAWLEFQHAYARKFEDYTDSLIVYISTDCGSNWSRIFAAGEDGSGSFATHEMTADFWPEVQSDWCMSGWGASCFAVNLDQWAGENEVKFAFESYSYYGNPIFIDNITISQFVGQDQIPEAVEEIRVFPNPAKQVLNIVIPESLEIDRVQLVNHLGQVVMDQAATGENKIQIRRKNNWTSGIYYLRASGKDSYITKKVILF